MSAPSETHQRDGLPSSVLTVMAVATAAIVANLYYAQPLLHQIAKSLHVGTATAAGIVTATQIGYAVGLLLVVPLGDLIIRRRLVPAVYLAAAASLVVCGLAGNIVLFEVGSAFSGLASVAGQIMVPFVADLAPAPRRARVVARLMSGLLLGIVLARMVSGLVAQAAGWRAIYWFSAAVMLIFAFTMARLLPSEEHRPERHYLEVIKDVFLIFATTAVLRRRAAHGAAAFAAFSVLWTSLAFLLSGAPYHYSNAIIGLFGLAGVAGVAAANVAGSWADKQRTVMATVLSALALVLSFVILALGRNVVLVVIVGIMVLDLGTQGMQLTNQGVIFSLGVARSRINSAYMTCYFLGGALGSFSAGLVLSHFGWTAVCVLGGAFGAISLLLAGHDHVRAQATISA